MTHLQSRSYGAELATSERIMIVGTLNFVEIHGNKAAERTNGSSLSKALRADAQGTCFLEQ